MTNRKEISVVWLKRDLRLNDNEAINNALKKGKKILFLYIFEEILIQNPHYSERHWNFIKQSLEEINTSLLPYNTKVLTVTSDALTLFNILFNTYKITDIYSYEEIDFKATISRNKEFDRYCRNNNINWTQSSNDGLSEKNLSKIEWLNKWQEYINNPLLTFYGNESNFIPIPEINNLSNYFKSTNIKTTNNLSILKGGSINGWQCATDFFNKNSNTNTFNNYAPDELFSDNSKLSPYISWGNISLREIYKKALTQKKQKNYHTKIPPFLTKIKKQAYLTHKFNSNPSILHNSSNEGAQKLKKNISQEYINAWKEGNTGFPIIDACMRCLLKTGHLNYKQRSIITSFFSNTLWQPWQLSTHHLSQMFIDFNPIIHFTQLENHSLHRNKKNYNPTNDYLKNQHSKEFITQWVPELKNLPDRFVHAPYLMGFLDEKLNNFKLDKDYTKPIININK